MPNGIAGRGESVAGHEPHVLNHSMVSVGGPAVCHVESAASNCIASGSWLCVANGEDAPTEALLV
jgi:hypothetical protein